MKRVVILLLLMCIILGCSKEESLITVEQVELSFNQHGIPLVENQEAYGNTILSQGYNQVTPKQFSITEHQTIQLYMYSSSKEAAKGLKELKHKISTSPADLVSHDVYLVANILLIYIGNDTYMTTRIKDIMEGFTDTK